MSTERTYVLPTRAHEDQPPVNYSVMSTFNKVDKRDVKNLTNGGEQKVEYYIIWSPDGAMQEGQTITWRYPSKTCRDQDYSDLIDKICLPLGS